MKTQNIFQTEKSFSVSEPEIVEKLHEAMSANINDLTIERIISAGQVSPENFWYDQQTNEWVVLLQGNALIEFDNAGITELEAGNYLFIPAHRRHRIIFTSSAPPCVWLAVHYN